MCEGSGGHGGHLSSSAEGDTAVQATGKEEAYDAHGRHRLTPCWWGGMAETCCDTCYFYTIQLLRQNFLGGRRRRRRRRRQQIVLVVATRRQSLFSGQYGVCHDSSWLSPPRSAALGRQVRPSVPFSESQRWKRRLSSTCVWENGSGH